jgi:hypothetical protein
LHARVVSFQRSVVQGTINLIDAAKEAKVPRFVLLSSLLTNAVKVGQQDNPNYKFLNLFGGVLDLKLEVCTAILR